MHRWESTTRYYVADLGRDLFGTWIVTRAWGGLGSRLGGTKTTPYPTKREAMNELRAIANTRRAHGYRPVAP